MIMDSQIVKNVYKDAYIALKLINALHVKFQIHKDQVNNVFALMDIMMI